MPSTSAAYALASSPSIWRVHLAGELIGVEVDEVFFEGFSLRDYFSGGIQDKARTVEEQTVIAADLIDHDDGNFVIARD